MSEELQLSFDDLEEDTDTNEGSESISDRFSSGRKVPIRNGGIQQESRSRDEAVASDDVPKCRRSCFNCLHGSRDKKIPDRSAVCSYGYGFVIPDADRKGGECGVWDLSGSDTYTYYVKEEFSE